MLLPRADSNNTYNTKESGDSYDLPNNSNNNDSRNVPRSVLSKILRSGEEGTCVKCVLSFSYLFSDCLLFACPTLLFRFDSAYCFFLLCVFTFDSTLYAMMFLPLVGDSTPLTTQAVRDLQRAQKERVFNRTLIRIK